MAANDTPTMAIAKAASVMPNVRLFRRTGVPALSYPGHASLRLRHLDDSDRIEQHGECHEHHKDGPIARPPSAHVIRVRRHADLTPPADRRPARRTGRTGREWST